MPKTAKVALLAVAWVVVAAVALGVAWRGVRIVDEHVTESRPAPLTSREIQERASAPATATPADATTTTTSASGPAPTVTTAATSPTVSTQQPAPPRATTTTAPRTTTTTRPPAPAETRTYSVTGGSASLRFSPSGVTVLWANPNPGYDVHVESENENGVKVTFESSSHRSRIDGWWDGGPQDRVREENR